MAMIGLCLEANEIHLLNTDSINIDETAAFQHSFNDADRGTKYIPYA